MSFFFCLYFLLELVVQVPPSLSLKKKRGDAPPPPPPPPRHGITGTTLSGCAKPASAVSSTRTVVLGSLPNLERSLTQGYEREGVVEQR